MEFSTFFKIIFLVGLVKKAFGGGGEALTLDTFTAKIK